MEKEKKIPTIYNKIQDKLTKKVSPLFHAPRAEEVYLQLAGGRNKYLKLDRIENTSYDPRWLDEIEDCIPDIDSIIKNPKKVIENVFEVVPIELARKTNSDSVKHLATHSQFVKEIDENGEVIPNKILNIRSDDFYQTYENRFIATLVRRLVLFVEKRYQIIQNNSKVQETQMLYFKNKSTVDGQEVEIETKVRVVSETEISEEETRFNKNFIKRIEEVRKYLLFFYNSEFMKKMKTEKNVRNPIIMTNIIRKNHIYNHCYRLYKFIEKFDNLGVEFKVQDKYEQLNQEQIDELNNALMTSFLALRGHETVSTEKEKIKSYKPKVVTTIDDEAFVYGDYVGGPVEFLRCDQGHIKYLDSLINKDVPAHPTKQEREFYKDDIEQNKKIKEEKRKIEKALKQKEKQISKIQKHFDDIVLQRTKEEEEELARLKKEEERLKLDEIERARRALVGLPAEYKLDEEKPAPTPEPIPEPVPEEPVQEEIKEVGEEVVYVDQSVEDKAPIEEEEVIKEVPVEEPVQEEPAPEEPVEEPAPEPVPEPIPEPTPEPVPEEPVPEPIKEEPKPVIKKVVKKKPVPKKEEPKPVEKKKVVPPPAPIIEEEEDDDDLPAFIRGCIKNDNDYQKEKKK